jgi:hypothetical protein
MRTTRETVAGMKQAANAATELAREHDEIDRLATRIAAHAPGPERTELVHELCTRFVVHAQVEERYLHPAVRTLLNNGAFAVTLQMRRNRAVGRTVACVERGELEDDEYDIVVSHLLVGVQDHVERQDAFLLPALVDVCPIEQINRLGEQLREGIAAGRRAVERAAARASSERVEEDACAAPPVASAAPVDPPSGRQARLRGFRALLQRVLIQRILRGGPALGTAR